jgi:hypothetical protein
LTWPQKPSHFLPLEQFQQTTLSEGDVKRLLAAINDAVAACNERNLSEACLNEAFDNTWPRLQERLEVIKKAIYEDEVSDTNQSLDLIDEFVGKALAEASGGGLSVERLTISVTRAMQTDKSKTLDVKSIALLVPMMQNMYLPKLMRSGYVKKEGEQYALTEGGLSHNTELMRSHVALEKRIEDMLRQGI